MPIMEIKDIKSQNKYAKNGEIIIISTNIQSITKSLNVMLILSLSFQSSQGFFFSFQMCKIVIFSTKLF